MKSTPGALGGALTGALGILLVSATAGLALHVPLADDAGRSLKWSDPSDIRVVLQAGGSDDLPEGAHEPALRMAMDAWNAVPGTRASLVEDTTPSQRARTDWRSHGVHLVMFDEANESGYFPGGVGVVAVTPVLYSNGRILDADVLFNGAVFEFSTSGEPGRFDVADVATHELGHLLGLDHSGWAGATMYPYADETIRLHRSLSSDDAHGLRQVYPAGPTGTLRGSVQRLSNDAPVAGANVVARGSDGRPVASLLTDPKGRFAIGGLEPDVYEVYAVPLGDGSGTGSDAPVDATNLGGRHVIETDFQAAMYDGSFVLTGDETVALGVLAVREDSTLNLGTESDRFPIQLVAGETRVIAVSGLGLGLTCTLEASDPDLVLGDPVWAWGQVSVAVSVPAGEEPGNVDLTVRKPSGSISILTAVLEITPVAPTVASVSPDCASMRGGARVTVTGDDFRPGARVVIGDRVYTDGIAGTAVVDASTIALTLEETVPGLHDVVVVDPTGVEGRSRGAFVAQALPTIATVFPPAGTRSGGTVVTIKGSDFRGDSLVRLDGVLQSSRTEDPSTLRFTTASGPTGPRLLEVENPGDGVATFAFTYWPSPDPTVARLTPAAGRPAGGEMVVIEGSGFTAASEVVFGSDPHSGAGGVPAASVTWLDDTRLEVVTPAFRARGPLAVLVREPASGQAAVAEAAFTVRAPEDGGGGGGGCAVVPVSGPTSAREVVAGGWWMLALVLLVGLRSRTERVGAAGSPARPSLSHPRR